MTEVPAYVVLGGTGGIGSELTRLLTSSGSNVLIAARGEERLRTLSRETGSEALSADATKDVASAIQWLLDPGQGWVTGRVLGVDGGLGSVRTMPRA